MKLTRVKCDSCKREFCPPVLGHQQLSEMLIWCGKKIDIPSGKTEDMHAIIDLCHACSIDLLRAVLNQHLPEKEQKHWAQQLGLLEYL